MVTDSSHTPQVHRERNTTPVDRKA